MPFFDQEAILSNPANPQPLSGAVSRNFPPEEPVSGTETPSLIEAAFRRENVLGSIGTELQFDSDIAEARGLGPEEGFDFMQSVPTRHIATAELYADTTNSQEADTITRMLDQEQVDTKALQETGGLGMAAMLTSIVSDPLTFVPVVTPLKLTSKLGTFGKVAAFAGINTVAPAGQELILQSTQQTRTVEESALVIGTSFLVGAYIGRVLNKNAELMKAHQAEIRAIVRGDDMKRTPKGNIDPDTFGAKIDGDDCP
jgi:hypothetical protein